MLQGPRGITISVNQVQGMSKGPQALHLPLSRGLSYPGIDESISWSIFHGPCLTFQQSVPKTRGTSWHLQEAQAIGGTHSQAWDESVCLSETAAFACLLVEARRPAGVQNNGEIKFGSALQGSAVIFVSVCMRYLNSFVFC